MGTLLSKLHPQWAAHVVIDAQTGAILLSGATEAQFDDWHRRYPMWRAPGTVEEVRPDLRPAYGGADTCTHYLVCDSCLALETARGDTVSAAQHTPGPKQVSVFYIEGIKEGRASFERYGMAIAGDELSNLKSTIKGFGASSSVGQMLRGERDFWSHQVKLAALAKAQEAAS